MSRRKRGSAGAGPPPTPAWLTTYGDMVTLLLTFFVLLQSFSTIEEKKLRQVISSIQGAMGGGGQVIAGGVGVLPGNQGNRPLTVTAGQPISPEVGKDMELTRDTIARLLGQDMASGQVEVIRDQRGVIIRILEPLLFDPGSAKLKPSGMETLAKLVPVLKPIPNPLIIEGHTCDLPIASSEFASNWELSTGRAVTVSRVLIERYGISPQRIAPTGFAEFRPVVPNTSEKNRALNRRVEIVILAEQ